MITYPLLIQGALAFVLGVSSAHLPPHKYSVDRHNPCCHSIKLTDQLPFKTRFPKSVPTYRRQVLTVYPKKYAHGFVVLCFVVVMQSFIMNSHEVFIHIHQGCFAGTGAIVRLPQCQWSKPDGYGKISECITTTKHSKAKTVCIFLGIYCSYRHQTPLRKSTGKPGANPVEYLSRECTLERK